MAAKLGRVNVDSMLKEITAKQFLEWEHYGSLEPFDEVRADYRAALIAMVIANVNRGPKQEAYKITDFLLEFGGDGRKRKQTPEEQLAIVKMIAASYSVTDRAL